MDFISAARAPSLERLELRGFIADDIDFATTTASKSLKLDSFCNFMDNSSYRLIPTQTLSELSLSGFTEASSLQPNSIHFPLLKILKMACVQRVKGFLNAFVVPNLERFHCSPLPDDPPSVALYGLNNKFNNVRHF